MSHQETDKALYFPDYAIMEFLRSYGKGPNSKDYEFVTALVLQKFCQRQWKVPCQIGFKIKPKYSSALPAEGMITLSDMANLFRKGIDEDNPIDVIIGKVVETPPIPGMQFQIKLFGKGQSNLGTEGLAQFINSLGKKYAKVSLTRLLIVLDMGVEVDFTKLQSMINTKVEGTPFFRHGF